jgi:hypothetical protein
MSVFAMALFLGKPAILVEHHEFFRNGPSGVEAFVSGLAKLRPDLRWLGLAEITSRTHLRRWIADGNCEVRFFTDTFKLDHDSTRPANYRILRRIPASTHVRRVTVDGVEIFFGREDELLIFHARASSPQTLRIQVEVAPVKPAKTFSSGIKYQASVAARRRLSEFRDNVIARNGFASRASKLVVKAFTERTIR